ncbi:MAG: hypothetical protein AB1831_10680 [Pseudomonadota bacterium]
MPSTTKTKTLYYFRAIRNKQPFDIQKFMRMVRSNKATCAASEVDLGGGDIVRIQRYVDSEEMIKIHLARYFPGVMAATLQPKVPTAEDDETPHAAPSGREFKDGDCFLLLKEHHVIFCADGINHRKAKHYLELLFKEDNLYEQTVGFDLAPASNLDTVKLIHEHGVKAIDLEVSAYALSLPQDKRKTWPARLLGGFSDEINALAAKDQSAAEQKALEDLMVGVQISLNGSSRAGEPSKRFIESMAQTLFEEDGLDHSSFSIITQKNEKIMADKIRLHTRVNLQTKQDNTVSHQSAWAEMERYFDDIRNAGLLEK